ncbi:hypothetical protein CR513_36835, partial [Mucuna pruriens]
MCFVVLSLNAPPPYDCAPSILCALSLASFIHLFAEPVSLAVMPESMVPASVPSYSIEHYEEWVSPDVLKQVSSTTPSEVDPSSANDFIMMGPFDDERICHAAQEDEDDFIFMYETNFEDLGISLPINFFDAEVLRMLRIALSQLHPNSWATLRAFETIC